MNFYTKKDSVKWLSLASLHHFMGPIMQGQAMSSTGWTVVFFYLATSYSTGLKYALIWHI